MEFPRLNGTEIIMTTEIDSQFWECGAPHKNKEIDKVKINK